MSVRVLKYQLISARWNKLVISAHGITINSGFLLLIGQVKSFYSFAGCRTDHIIIFFGHCSWGTWFGQHQSMMFTWCQTILSFIGLHWRARSLKFLISQDMWHQMRWVLFIYHSIEVYDYCELLINKINLVLRNILEACWKDLRRLKLVL